jgi:hypothetical protein|tara:strand:- start:298 stop:447 length:150 start_codon:yes stop_codon:yes gene_type:complete
MIDYERMNRILEEEGTIERSDAETESYAEYEADVWIRKQEDDAEELYSY